MEAKELVLNIAVNLGRIGRWANEGRSSRLHQFLEETEGYVSELEKMPKSKRFMKTFDNFRSDFNNLKNNVIIDSAWSEMMFTWANILTHRAKLV